MKKPLQLLLLALLLLPAEQIAAQGSAYVVDSRMATPGRVCNLSVVDSTLYCCVSDVLMVVEQGEGMLNHLRPDTTIYKIEEGVQYVVRQPVVGDLYMTKQDRKGNSRLYRYSLVEGRNGKVKGKLKKVSMNGMNVEHPVFSADGMIMVFSATDKRHSAGGYDLWYSRWEDDEWSRPLNIGTRINTPGDEVSPTIFGPYLVFATNGRSEDAGSYTLYTTRLLSNRVIGDTVGMFQIGRNRLFRLPEPFNQPHSDCFDMAFDSAATRGYWLAYTHDKAQAYEAPLCSFTLPIDGVIVWGRVTDAVNASVDGVTVSAIANSRRLCSTLTDADGFYRLYLPKGTSCNVEWSSEGYFSERAPLPPIKYDEELVFQECRLDQVMRRLPVGEPFVITDLFGPDADVELSTIGHERLAPLVRFLKDNPQMSVSLTLTSHLSDDISFNRLLTERRLQSLKQYLEKAIPSTVKISLVNGCFGLDGCTTDAVMSRLQVLIY